MQGFCCLCALERFCIAKNYYRFGFQVGTTLILILIHNCWNISTQVINSPPYHNKLLALPKPLELQCVPAHYCIVIGYIFSSPFGKAVRLHHRNMKLIPGMSTGWHYMISGQILPKPCLVMPSSFSFSFLPFLWNSISKVLSLSLSYL